MLIRLRQLSSWTTQKPDFNCECKRTYWKFESIDLLKTSQQASEIAVIAYRDAGTHKFSPTHKRAHTHTVSSGSLQCLIPFQSMSSNSLVPFKPMPFSVPYVLFFYFLRFSHALLVRGKSYIRDQRQVCLSQTLSLLLIHTHMTIWCHSRSLTHSNWGKRFSSWALKSTLIQSSSIRNTSLDT